MQCMFYHSVVGRLFGRDRAADLPSHLPAWICVCLAPAFARARSNINVVIGGSIMTGFTLATYPSCKPILSEVLPLKYRTVANGSGAFPGAHRWTVGQLPALHSILSANMFSRIGSLGAGALTEPGPNGMAQYILGPSCLSSLCFFPHAQSDTFHSGGQTISGSALKNTSGSATLLVLSVRRWCHLGPDVP